MAQIKKYSGRKQPKKFWRGFTIKLHNGIKKIKAKVVAKKKAKKFKAHTRKL